MSLARKHSTPADAAGGIFSSNVCDFWSDGRATLYQGDAMALVTELPDASVDAVITDVPYCSGGMIRGDRMQSTTAKYVQSGAKQLRADFTGDNRDQRGFAFWLTMLLSELRRVTVAGGTFATFIDWRQLPTMTDVLQAAGWVWRGIGVWDKTEGCRPQLGRPRNQVEYLVYGTNGPQPRELCKAIGVIPGVIRSSVRQADKLHITGKPLDVMKWAVRLCPAGGKVLDPFSGSNTTGIACAETGRTFIGMELDPYYFSLGLKRYKAAAA